MDVDLGENGHVVYALEPGTKSSSLFRIDPATGNVLMRDELPVNDINTTYHVTVIARDAGVPVKSSALRVTILVFFARTILSQSCIITYNTVNTI